MASHSRDRLPRRHQDIGHSHLHGWVAPAIATTTRGMQVVRWSCARLLVTILLQLVVVRLSGRVALLADTVHNLGDAATALPPWIAFALLRRRLTHRFTYCYCRLEDVAGVVILFIIAGTALMAA